MFALPIEKMIPMIAKAFIGYLNKKGGRLELSLIDVNLWLEKHGYHYDVSIKDNNKVILKQCKKR